jgi:hypothetical protein
MPAWFVCRARATIGCDGCCGPTPRTHGQPRALVQSRGRGHGTEGAGPRAVAPTSHAPPPTRSCTGWYRNTWRPSSPRPPRAPTESGCPTSSNGSSAPSSGADCSSMAFRECGAMTVRASVSSRCRAKAAQSAPAVAGGAWRSRRRISSKRFCPGSPSGNGSSPCPTGCATGSPSTTRSVGPSSGCSCGPCSAGTAGGRAARTSRVPQQGWRATTPRGRSRSWTFCGWLARPRDHARWRRAAA